MGQTNTQKLGIGIKNQFQVRGDSRLSDPSEHDASIHIGSRCVFLMPNNVTVLHPIGRIGPCGVCISV